MSEGYACNTCAWAGNDPDFHRELEKIDEGAAFYVVVTTCPDCGGDELREVDLCLDCETVEAEPGDDYCRTCRAVIDSEAEDFRRDQIQETRLLLQQED